MIICALCAVMSVSCGMHTDRVQTKREKKLHADAAEVCRADRKYAEARNRAVSDYVSRLSLKDQVAQLFLVNIEGDESYIPVERKDGLPYIPGGYIFFSYNIAGTPGRIIGFTDSIRDFCTANGVIPPYLALDQEGGDVSRLRGRTGPLPSEERVSQMLSVGDAYSLYSMQAMQMKLLGFTADLAPVAEVRGRSNSVFLGDRSFGSASSVIAYGTAEVNALQNNGVAAVLKHFPGNTNTDPHTGLPEIRLSMDELESDVIMPFSRLACRNPAGVLMSHARTEALDPGTPACLSSSWVNGKLRGEACFDGLVFSDDIFMKALAGNGYPPEKAAVRAVEAGVDVIMISEKRFSGPASVLMKKAESDKDFAQKIHDAAERVIRFKLQYGVLDLEMKDGDWYVVPVVTHDFPCGIDRAASFEKIKEENESFYKRYFVKDGGAHAQK